MRNQLTRGLFLLMRGAIITLSGAGFYYLLSHGLDAPNSSAADLYFAGAGVMFIAGLLAAFPEFLK